MTGMTVGFIGLGNLGLRLVLNLIDAGIKTYIYDADDTKKEFFQNNLEIWLRSPKEIAERADIVVTCLPSPEAVASVLESKNGLLEGIDHNKLWIEMSTTDSQELLRLAKLVEKKGSMVLEAPVSGGCHRASTGNISILVGGERAAFEKALPILKIIGFEIVHVGELGKASILKVVTNFLASTHLVAIGEALMVCKKAGIDLGKTYNAIKVSSGNSFVHETESQVILSGSYNVNFTMDLVCKDVGLFQKLVTTYRLKTELSKKIVEIFEKGKSKYGSRGWSTQVVKLLEDENSESLRAEGFPEELVDKEPKNIGREL